MTRTATLILALFSLGTGLTACGGGDDNGVTKKQFANKADAICKGFTEKLHSIGQGVDSAEKGAAAMDKGIDAANTALDDLKALDVPEGDAGETAEKFQEGFEQDVNDVMIPAFEDARDAFKENDIPAAQEASQRLQELGEKNKSGKFASDLGATECAS